MAERPKAADSRSALAGVPRFESWPRQLSGHGASGPAGGSRTDAGWATGLLHGSVRFRRSIPTRRFPQLEPVPVGVVGPPEPPVGRLLHTIVDPYPGPAQLVEKAAKVIHAIVDLSGRFSGAPGPIPGAQRRPERASGAPRAPSRSPIPRGDLAPRRDRKAEVFAVPGRQPQRRPRPQEHSSDARDPRPAARGCAHGPGIRPRQMNNSDSDPPTVRSPPAAPRAATVAPFGP